MAWCGIVLLLQVSMGCVQMDEMQTQYIGGYILESHLQRLLRFFFFHQFVDFLVRESLRIHFQEDPW